jgi:hypothetical protein
MYASAAQCDLSKGFDVGEAAISFVGDNLTVDILLDKETYYLESTHVYVGSTAVPMTGGKKHKPTFSPGQFGHVHDPLMSKPTSDLFEIPVTLAEGYIIVYASVCGVESTSSRRLMLRGHEDNLS